MKKKYYLFLLLVCIAQLKAQSADKGTLALIDKASKSATDTIKNGWHNKGKVSLLFNQSSFSTGWQAGGDSNISATLGLNYDFNYKKDNMSWDNKIIAAYGTVKTKGDAFAKKTDDRFTYNTLGGRKIANLWYASFFLNFNSQFAKGYTYETINNIETRSLYTKAFSPAYLSLGPGFMWKKSDNLKFNLAPLTSKMTFVDSSLTLPNQGYFGVNEGKGFRYELGFNGSAYYKFNLMKNVSVENILNLYSNYLSKPQNIDIDYTLNVSMTINKLLSANFALQTIYDDDAYKGFQVRQVFGVALNYLFGNEVKK